jgi:hypothetical protein
MIGSQLVVIGVQFWLGLNKNIANLTGLVPV